MKGKSVQSWHKCIVFLKHNLFDHSCDKFTNVLFLAYRCFPELTFHLSGDVLAPHIPDLSGVHINVPVPH